jgi:RNA polymerase I-specific transcription initiation factor RRN6
MQYTAYHLLAPMTDPSPNDLNFGHFGVADYNLDNSEWAFSRNPRRKELKSLGPWRTASTAAIQYPTPILLRPARSIQQTARELARDYAHLAPAIEQLPELETISAAAISATNAYDATIGCLLSFGSITCKGHSDHRPKPIVATPVGEVGNLLQLQVVEKERHGWDELQAYDRGLCLEGPSLTGGDRGYWNEEAAPIRQICFAEGEERSTFLAIRLPQRTVLFRPSYVHKAKVANQSKHFDLPPSNIDPCPIRSITVNDTGGIPHADVSFNPEYQRQAGIVDEQGHWSIWDIDDGYRADNYKVTCSIVGDLSHMDAESALSEKLNHVTEDGWARILWCGDANTVVVANRRRISIFNVKGGLTMLKSPRVIPERSADWILDVKRHPTNKKHFFLLTSTRLFLVAVTCPSDDPEFTDTEPGAAVLLSWTHFRGMDDITIQLCLHITSEEGMFTCFEDALR